MSDIKYKILTFAFLIIFPPAGIAFICFRRNKMTILGKAVIIFFDLMWMAVIGLLLIYSRSPVR